MSLLGPMYPNRRKEPAPPRRVVGDRKWLKLLLAGGVCLLVVLLTHVAEALQILPWMGWGLPDSPGHYLDLGSAVAAAALLPAACITRRLSK